MPAGAKAVYEELVEGLRAPEEAGAAATAAAPAASPAAAAAPAAAPKAEPAAEGGAQQAAQTKQEAVNGEQQGQQAADGKSAAAPPPPPPPAQQQQQSPKQEAALPQAPPQQTAAAQQAQQAGMQLSEEAGTLAWIQYMRFARRAEGIMAARKVRQRQPGRADGRIDRLLTACNATCACLPPCAPLCQLCCHPPSRAALPDTLPLLSSAVHCAAYLPPSLTCLPPFPATCPMSLSQLFMRARKWPAMGWQAYAASALMEWRHEAKVRGGSTGHSTFNSCMFSQQACCASTPRFARDGPIPAHYSSLQLTTAHYFGAYCSLPCCRPATPVRNVGSLVRSDVCHCPQRLHVPCLSFPVLSQSPCNAGHHPPQHLRAGPEEPPGAARPGAGLRRLPAG